ncbi:4-hydroxybenzoate polyprenyltransferase, mitochondrial [Mycena kentingensis (nom. inval.)]|nr:4-hydroxybenzoate polyprenyltransferase, mitochondrial [Mycena kentingensis (nom. inval.)]
MTSATQEKAAAAAAAKANLKFPLNYVPAATRPYLELIRLEKVVSSSMIDSTDHRSQPTGTWLMFWPGAWGLTMAAYHSQPSYQQYAISLGQALVGAFLLRSSACTINDIFDKNMDAGVERTKGRPLPSGRISVLAATIYLLLQYAAGVAFFYATMREEAFQVSVFQLIPLFAVYPLLKRVTYWPQAWLGLAMNFGFIPSWLALSSSNSTVFWAAMAGCWCWTMLYDTIYACQDIKGDLKVGVRSTAILFGSWIRVLLVGCGLGFVSMLAVAGVANEQGLPYFAVAVGGTALHLLWQAATVDLNVPKSCWTNFNRNGQLGWIVWGGMMLDYVVAKKLVELR